MPEVLHSRFRYTPSGPLHVGHAILAWLNREAARSTGGTFLIRCESLKNTQSLSRMQNYRKWWRVNYEELCSFGLTPTPPEVLNSIDGLNADMAFMVSEDHVYQQYYWKELGLEKQFGEWPPPWNISDDGPNLGNTDFNWQAITLGNYEYGSLHPYIIFAQAVTEVRTRRNCLIRGDDHRPEAVMFNTLSQLIARKMFSLPSWDHTAQYTPIQWFIPKIYRSGERLPKDLQQPGGVVLASSLIESTTGFYIKDLLKAGVQPYTALRFLAKILFGSQDIADWAWTMWGAQTSFVDPDKRPGVQGGVKAIMEAIVDKPIIDDDEWFWILKKGT